MSGAADQDPAHRPASLGRHRDLDIDARPRLHDRPRPERGRQDRRSSAAIELALFGKATATAPELDPPADVGARPTRSTHGPPRVHDRARGRQDRPPEDRRGVAREGVPGRQRSRVARDRRRDDHRPGPADEIIAELPASPTRRSSARRRRSGTRRSTTWTATRARSATVSRAASAAATRAARGPRPTSRTPFGTLKARGDKNPGRLKVAEEAVARAEAAVAAGNRWIDQPQELTSRMSGEDIPTILDAMEKGFQSGTSKPILSSGAHIPNECKAHRCAAGKQHDFGRSGHKTTGVDGNGRPAQNHGRLHTGHKQGWQEVARTDCDGFQLDTAKGSRPITSGLNTSMPPSISMWKPCR